MSITLPPFIELPNADATDNALLIGAKSAYEAILTPAYEKLSAQAKAREGAEKWAEESDDPVAVDYREFVEAQTAEKEKLEAEIKALTESKRAEVKAVDESLKEAKAQMVKERGQDTGFTEEELLAAAASWKSGRDMLKIALDMIAGRPEHKGDPDREKAIDDFLKGFGSVRQVRSGKGDGGRSDNAQWKPRFTSITVDGNELDKPTAGQAALALGINLSAFKEVLSEQAFAGDRPSPVAEGTYHVTFDRNGNEVPVVLVVDRSTGDDDSE